VAALGARGGWDESAARLHAVLQRACGVPAGEGVATNDRGKAAVGAN
jgi:hypothetical protein